MTDAPHGTSPICPEVALRRALERAIGDRRFARMPVRTALITEDDDIVDLVEAATRERLDDGDVVMVSEKVVAITQGRAPRECDLRIGWLARVLWRFVKKSPYGVGLRRPSSMQCAINECGATRILAATIVGALGKLVGRSGDFYRVAGMQAATIDAAGTSPLQADRVIMGPRDPEGVARAIAARLGVRAAVMDVNDIGGSRVLGASEGVERRMLEALMNDNPLGQKAERTPICVIRERLAGAKEDA